MIIMMMIIIIITTTNRKFYLNLFYFSYISAYNFLKTFFFKSKLTLDNFVARKIPIDIVYFNIILISGQSIRVLVKSPIPN